MNSGLWPGVVVLPVPQLKNTLQLVQNILSQPSTLEMGDMHLGHDFDSRNRMSIDATSAASHTCACSPISARHLVHVNFPHTKQPPLPLSRNPPGQAPCEHFSMRRLPPTGSQPPTRSFIVVFLHRFSRAKNCVSSLLRWSFAATSCSSGRPPSILADSSA